MAPVYGCHFQHNCFLRSSKVNQQRHLSITSPWRLPLVCASGCCPDLATLGSRGHSVGALRGYNIFECYDIVDGCRLSLPARSFIAVVEAPPAETSQNYLPIEGCLHGTTPLPLPHSQHIVHEFNLSVSALGGHAWSCYSYCYCYNNNYYYLLFHSSTAGRVS